MTVYIKTLIPVTNHTKNPEAHHKRTENNPKCCRVLTTRKQKVFLAVPSLQKVLHVAVKTFDAGFILDQIFSHLFLLFVKKHSVLVLDSQISLCSNTTTSEKNRPILQFLS